MQPHELRGVLPKDEVNAEFALKLINLMMGYYNDEKLSVMEILGNLDIAKHFLLRIIEESADEEEMIN